MSILIAIAVLVFCYLMGAIPTGLIVGRRCKGIDIREHGSKNIGATNVWRVMGWKYGLTTFLIDVGKALAAVLFVPVLATGSGETLQVLGGVAVLLGNFFNVFLGFKGGKGVAASLGVFLGLAPIPVAIAFAIFLVVVFLSRHISLGSILAAASLPFLVLFFSGTGPLFVAILLVAILVIYKHRANVVRLVNGTEPKFSLGKKSDTATQGS